MRVVIQRVKSARVSIGGKVKDKIGAGVLIFVGVEDEDTMDDITRLTYKITRLRIFPDESGKMNLSLWDTDYKAMVISQFTLFASTKKGSRPSFTGAGKPEFARMMYEMFCLQLGKELNNKVASGEFGADMQVSLVNDGPVTICIDTKAWE
ncbi:MAG: D-aminoacyl-tRNA deacylase [Flavobacteriales bacterium]